MKVSWYAPAPDGKPGFTASRIDVPGRYNFIQAAIYRLKLSDIANRPGVELYPTLEVVPSNALTDAFLAHSAVPVSFTNEDFDQVIAGNYLVKVIYLPNPAYQEFVTTGPEEVVSSRLEPGANPIAEAQRRGSILLVIRLGNIDLELANSPPMDAPGQYGPKPHDMPGHGMAPGGHGMMMTPNGPMMMAPNGRMPVPQGMPVMPPMNGTGQPVSMLPDAADVQQSQFLNATTTIQTSEKVDRKTTPSKKWWWAEKE
jgi:hypothetical protein